MAKIALQGNDAGTGTFTLQVPASNLNRNLVLPDVDGTLSTMEQVKLPIGSFMWFTGTVAPEAFVVADGQLRSRAAFPDLWAFAQASGNISVDDASWTFGQYSPGDGATTFRVPKVDDRFIRGKSATRHVGLVEEDQFKSHTHAVGEHNNAGASNTNPAVLQVGPSSTPSLGYGDTSSTGGDETRPKALTMLPCIKAYDVISDPSVLNAVAVVNEISRLESEKLRKDENINLGVSVAASGTAVDFVGIPEGVKRITVMFNGVSANGTSKVHVQLGIASGPETSGYLSTTFRTSTTSLNTGEDSGGFAFDGAGGIAAHERNGNMVLTHAGGNMWTATGMVRNQSIGVSGVAGLKQLSGTLDRIRITTVNGTDQFDAGTINISWEF